MCAYAYYLFFSMVIALMTAILMFTHLFGLGNRILRMLHAYTIWSCLLQWAVLVKGDAYDAYRGYLVHFISVMGGVVFYRYGIFEKVRSLLGKARMDKWWFYLLVSLLGLGLLAVFRRGVIAPYALLPLLFLFVSIFDEHKVPRWLDFGLSWLGKLSMPLWFIHYVFFAGYVNAIVPLFDIVSSARVGVAIVLLALVMCIPVALIHHFVFMGVRMGVLHILLANRHSPNG